MCIVIPQPTAHKRRRHWAPAPWHDDHPRRLELDRELARDHLARRIDAAVASLNLEPLCACYAGCGSPPYPPALLLRAVLYESQCGRHSPAEWYRDAHELAPLRWLLQGATPSRSAWYAFRDRVGPVLDTLQQQVLAQAVAAGLTPATRGAEDGTLVAAHASRHRLLKAATLAQRAEQLEQARAADARGEAPAPLPQWMARRPAGRTVQHQRLTRAQAALQARQARNQRKRASKRQRPERLVVSLSDPEAAVGLDKEKVYRPLYNVQVIDDLDSPFILASEVFAQPHDAGLLATLLARARAALGHGLEVLLADTAYAGGADLAAAAQAGVTVYAPLPHDPRPPGALLPKTAFPWDVATQTYSCPQGHRLEYAGTSAQKRSGTATVQLHRYRCPPEHCTACPLQRACTPNPAAGRTISRSEHEPEIEALRARMQTDAAQTLYRLRRQTVELVNADWKQHRKLRRFSGRGLARARAQVGLIVLAHNLLTLLSETRKADVAATANPAANTT